MGRYRIPVVSGKAENLQNPLSGHPQDNPRPSLLKQQCAIKNHHLGIFLEHGF